MKRSILEGKQILAVDEDPVVLEDLERKILETGLKCRFDKVTTYVEAVEMMVSLTYDLVLLDVTDARSLDLLNLVVLRRFPVAVLASNALNPDVLKRSAESGAVSYLPKDRLREIVPFLEDTLYKCLPRWKRFSERMKGTFRLTFRPDSDARIGYSFQE